MPAVKLRNPAPLYLPLLLLVHLVMAQTQVTTPFASLPGMTTQQVLRSILPPDVIPYSAAVVPEEAGTFRAVLRVHNRGMEHLYKLTNMFLSFIQPQEVVPPGIELSLDPELMVSQARTEWKTILLHYAGIASTALVGILLAIGIPLIGFFICCCRCGGRCGAKDEPFEKQRDKCKRVILGILFGVFLLLVAFGVICAFVSNSNVQDGVNGLPPTLRNAAHDTSVYFNSTRRAYTTLLTVNYRELEAALSKALDDSGRLVTDELKYVSRAVAMDNLTSIASNLGTIRLHLNEIERDTQSLQDHARELKSGLADVKAQMEALLQQCKELPACELFSSQYSLDRLSIDRKFLEMPDVQRMARNISSLIATGVESEVKRGRDSLQSVAFEVQRAIGNTLPKVKDQLRTAGQKLERTAEDIAMLLTRNIEFVNGPAIQSHIDTLQTYIDDYGPYRFYIDIGMASLVLLILLCFAFGLACGCYGKRPADPYDDEFGTKGTGASCLMAGVGLLFMTSMVLMLLTTAHFLVGAIGEKLSCEVLNDLGTNIDDNSQQQELHDFVNRILPLTQLYPHGVVKDDVVTVSNIVRECHQNRTLYEMLQLERLLNVTSLAEMVRKMNIEDEVRRLTANLAFDQQMVLLTPSAKEQLRAFANSEVLGVNFTAYSVALERDITNVNLLDMAIVLNNTAVDVQPYDANAANILWNNSLFLEALQSSHLAPMKSAAQRLRIAATALEQRVRFNQSSLPEAIEMLIEQADAAQKFLRSQGPQELTKLAIEFGRECERLIDDYVNRVADHVVSKIGKCGPLSQAYNTTAGVVCQQIFYPFNGFWASIGWCVLLFLPCVALALILAKLYRKTDPYPGSLVETRDRRGMAYPAGGGRSGHSYGHVYGYEDDYSYSQHQARTGRPSAQAAAANGTNGTSGTSGSAVVAPAERGGKAHSSRYQDVAPRAWSESSPSRASPRYVASPVHAPSTSAVAGQQPTAPAPDYSERPPPYYYPGPADIK